MEGTCAVYYNHWLYIDYLMTESNSLLMESLFIVLLSFEIIALTRACEFVHFPFILSMRWLVRKTHELAKANWSVASMDRVNDVLCNKFQIIVTDDSKFIDGAFAMNILGDFVKELPPFDELLQYIFEVMVCTTVDGKTKVLPADVTRCELFYPTGLKINHLLNFSKILEKNLPRFGSMDLRIERK